MVGKKKKKKQTKNFSSLYILGLVVAWDKREKKEKKNREKKSQSWAPNLRRNSCPNVARPRKAVVCLTSSAAIANFGLCARTSLPVSSFFSSLGICYVKRFRWFLDRDLVVNFLLRIQSWFFIRYGLNPPDPCLFVSCGWLLLCCLFCSVLVPLLLFLLLVNCVCMKFWLFVLFAGWRFFFFFLSTLLVLNSFLGLRFVSIWMVLDAAWFVFREL